MLEVFDPDMASFETAEGYINIAGGGVFPITYTVCGDLAVVDGDIVIATLETMRRMSELVNSNKDYASNEASRNEMIENACAIKTAGKYWPNAAIYYEMGSASNVTAIEAAIKYLNKYTPLSLFNRKNEANYVVFEQSAGCSSYIGMQGGAQKIRIANWAAMGNVAHEILHAAGLWHEQSRTDRDYYVTIDLGNLSNPSAKDNFKIQYGDSINVATYDYGSIMHYSENAFAKPGTKTIVPKKAGVVIGQRSGASQTDKLGLAYIYASSVRTP